MTEVADSQLEMAPLERAAPRCSGQVEQRGGESNKCQKVTKGKRGILDPVGLHRGQIQEVE